ncbi:unnamed protein product [marine sediment metagenome]|uniref:Uncharacterized protein n=1 Tax=marine sediment metagenome TaxID=412755 RepID=X1SW82_9ZZZZ
MILSKRNFKTVYGETDLELEAKTGQALVIKNILIHNPLLDYITVAISKTTVGYFRVGGVLGSHLSFHIGSVHLPVFDTYTGRVNQTTLLEYLSKLGLFTGYPVASGEKFLITGANQATSIQTIEYEIWEAADITPEMENGSKSTSFFYVNYGRSPSTINVETDVLLDTTNNPKEFPDFPYGNIVPSGRNIELHGILASDVKPMTWFPDDRTYTQFLKFMQGKVFLFDEDRQGLTYYADPGPPPMAPNCVGEGTSLGGNYSNIDMKYPLMFDPPLLFPQGQELTIYWKCGKLANGTAISTALQEIGLILKMTPIS